MSSIAVTEATFETDVIERSREVPVVVDFWAEWCRPCHVLGPILEKLSDEAQGRWVLAKIDVDSNQALATTFGIQGIPAVKAFKDGRPVAEFVGALPEDQVRRWLDGIGPGKADRAFEAGRHHEDSGNLESAKAAYERALREDPGHIEAKSGLARVDLALRAGDLDEAGSRDRLARDPADVDAAISVADALASRGELDRAFDVLLETLRGVDGDRRERARLHLLFLLDTIPAADPRAIAARRALSAALF